MTASVFRSWEELEAVPFGPCALAIGNFDGVHIGHQELIRHASEWARQQNLKSAVLTFHPHPAAVVAPDRLPAVITPLDLRLRYLAEAGAEHIFVLPFSEAVSRLSPREFVSDILIRALQTKAVFVGENFRFAYKQAGTPSVLRELGPEYGFHSNFLPPVRFRAEVVSSSAVRRYLQRGAVVRAARLLGRCFALPGSVVKGHGIGARQTVPTLNLEPNAEQIVPPGVYATETFEARTGRSWYSITNAGFRPTFGGDRLTVETFLLDPVEGSSPEDIEVHFQHFIRPERKFANADALKQQIMRDVERTARYRKARAWAHNVLAQHRTLYSR
jgi:riboflavin kinase/FMN adenylyltransferase